MSGKLMAWSLILAVAGTVCAQDVDREAVVRGLLERSRLVEDAQFTVPRSLWGQYIRETTEGLDRLVPPPVAMIPEEGLYRLTVPADGPPTLAATLRLRVFQPENCTNMPVLTSAFAWDEITVDDRPANLSTARDWMRFSPENPGEYVISARVVFEKARKGGGSYEFRVPKTVRTVLSFDSPSAWEVSADATMRSIRGSKDGGTHGTLAVAPTDRVKLEYSTPSVVREHPPRYQVKGNIAWNLDAGGRQVAAKLNIAIVGGRTERIDLILPPSADRVSITGPDVREIQPADGGMAVFLRGKVSGQTRLTVNCETPPGKGDTEKFGGLAVRDGHWAEGTFVVTNTAGGSEVLPATMTGLEQLALADIPASASAILSGPAVLAYRITSRAWSAEVEIVNLGEFALRETIADLAHYQMSFRDDGSIMCKATYEIRNRNRQFLRVDLPADAIVLMARVNEKSRPITPVPGADDAWLLPLIRSTASLKGLVSFPVEVLFLCRTAPLAGSAEVNLPLPRVDLPIAYAWCEAYVPGGMKLNRWGGPLRNVEKYSSETATAELAYGRSVAAEGYERDKGEAAPKAEKKKAEPEKKKKPGKSWFGRLTSGFERKRLNKLADDQVDRFEVVHRQPVIIGRKPAPPKQKAPKRARPAWELSESNQRLARNYFRAGRDFYEKGDYDKAVESLTNVLDLAPDSPQAKNAERLMVNVKDLISVRKKLGSQAEKAAAAQVKREFSAANILFDVEQQRLVEKGTKAAREGRVQEAFEQFQAAEALSGKLIGQGADVRAQDARLRGARAGLKKAQKRERAAVKDIRKQVKQLKGRGQYGAALQTAKQLGRFQGQGRAVGQRALQDELSELTILAAKEQARARKRDGLQRRVRELRQKHAVFKRISPSVHERIAGKPGGSERYKFDGKLPDDVDELEKEIKKLEAGLAAIKRVSPLVYRTDVGGAVPRRAAPRRGRGKRTITKLYDGRDLGITSAKEGRKLGQQFADVIAGEGDADRTQPGTGIVFSNGKLVVTHTPTVQTQVLELLNDYRAARGPQIELGLNFAGQRAKGWIQTDEDGQQVAITNASGSMQNELLSFIGSNYVSQLGGLSGSRRKARIDELLGKARYNLGQQVQVSSINLNGTARDANALGIRFTTGNNGVVYSVIDEAQFRTLRELDVSNIRAGYQTTLNSPNWQNTIVGTDALLANDMVGNVTFAGDAGNKFDINDNPISLSHEKYILIDNGKNLTALRSGEMVHWQQAAEAVQFAEVPQDIDVPRVGQLFKFEKTLVRPADKLVLRASYNWKGDRR